MALLRCVAVLILLCHAAAVNMNGEYMIANSLTYSTEYKADYFEVYSPVIRTQYSQVYWRMQDPVPLPPSILKRFNNSIMAVVGYEVDQVQRTASGEDVSVPITWAYNHHYGAYLLNSKKAMLVKKQGTRRGMNHGSNEYWTATSKESNKKDSDFPLMTYFSEGNGGEWRRSYHGYPAGYAQLIEAPDTFHIFPMQIDTWNRDTRGADFRAGPLPASSRIPPNAGYSGLIECPCSDRVAKEWAMTYAREGSHECTAAIRNASECLVGAPQVIPSGNYVNMTISDSSKPSGCFVVPHADFSTDVVWNSKGVSTAAAQDSNHVIAFAHAKVNLTVELETDIAKITLVGPADKWFGVGFGANVMCIHMIADECPDGGPYAIIVSGDDVVERKLDFHGPGTMLEPSVTVSSNVVISGVRTVVLTRSLAGMTSKYYTFVPSVVSVPLITAIGCGLPFAQHCGHEPSELNFFALDTPTRICEAGISGSVRGNKFDKKRCAPFPTSDLKAQQNPTCSAETYRGGLSCCQDAQYLLDKEQEIPWADQYLEYQLKFRFYYEEYHPASADRLVPSHHSLVRLYWMTEAHAGEYDIVQCKDGVPPSQCIQVISSRWKVRDMMVECPIRPEASWCTGKDSSDANKTQGVELIYAGPHCHAPSCLSMELYNADTGQLLCHMEPIRGQSNQVYDENGFLAIPPCLWGSEAEGLQPPELLSLDTNLLSIKRNNSTLSHTGEMASWQMRGIVIPKDQVQSQATESLEEVLSATGRRDRLRSAPSDEDST